MLHALHTDRDNRRNIVVRANDIDVAVILIYNAKFIENRNIDIFEVFAEINTYDNL